MKKNKNRILIVDDVTSNRLYLAQILKSMGIDNITEAKSGNLAWDLIKESVKLQIPFDTILTDIKMLDGDGLELLAKIRGNKPTSKTKVFLVTTVKERDKIIEAKNLQANGYIVKPFEKHLIEEKLEFLIEEDEKEKPKS